MSRKKIVTVIGCGERLKSIRESLGVSQREFGRLVGVSGAHVSQVESGQRPPSMDLVFGLVIVNASADWLLWERGRMRLDSEDIPGVNSASEMDDGVMQIVRFIHYFWDSTDSESRAWLKGHLRRSVPEFDAWLRKRAT